MEYSYNAFAVDIANFSINMANDKRNISIGHLVKLKVGGVDIGQGFEFPDPMSPKALTPMACMLTSFHWNGNRDGRLTLEGRVPYMTKGKLQGAISDNDKTPECELHINFFEPEGEKSYRTGFTTKDIIKGKIIRTESDVYNEKKEDYTNIPNHYFKLVLDPSDTANQELHFDFGNKEVRVFPWGGQVKPG